MLGSSCLYRRPSGIYVVRIAVPKRLRNLIGRGEIHASTRLTDWNAAKLAALKIQFYWRERFMVLDAEKLSAGSPLLLGEGLIPVNEAAMLVGMPTGALLSELLRSHASIFTQAFDWGGWQVPDLGDVERDYDDRYVLNDIEKKGTWCANSNILKIHRSNLTISRLISEQQSAESLFLLGENSAFFTEDEHLIALSACMVSKIDVERVRANLAGKLVASPVLSISSPVSPVLSSAETLDPIEAKHGKKKFSYLFELYKKTRTWGEDQNRRMATESGLFIELMNDPELGSIDAEMILEYANTLMTLPGNIYQSKRKYKVDTLQELIEIAKSNNLQVKTGVTVKGHIGKLSEILNYGVKQRMLTHNPASDYKAGSDRFKKFRAQDARKAFGNDDLALIFSQEWFKNGSGKFSASGHTNWRPHHFWLPILGLLTGARLNELSQLYLDDVVQSDQDNSIWYLDFNLDQSDKTDEPEKPVEPDKKLKTVNSIRIVPLHELFIKLGLPEYVKALRNAGEKRLFPELKRDRLKGYGKPAGSWFNERFLGKKLKIERNGEKTFHSFRHTFLTAADRTDLPENVLAQLAGHQRGKTESKLRYVKDRTAVELQGPVNNIQFSCVNSISEFDTQAALKALKIAYRRKNAVI